ncbi:MAG: SpoIIE family protein phosphatase [Acidobacteriota bacterium]
MFTGEELILGRSTGCDVVLRDQYLSRRHTRMVQSDGRVMVEDLGSRNGTLVNGRAIAEPTPVGIGDVIQLGGCRIHLDDATTTSGTGTLPTGVKTIFRKAAELIEDQPGDPELYSHRLKLLNQLHVDLARPMNLAGLLDLVLEQAFRHLEPEEGAVFLERPDGTFELSASRSLAGAKEPYPYSRSLVREVVEKGLAALVLDLQADERFAASESILSSGLRSLVAAPLLAPEGTLGMIVVNSRRHVREFREEDMQLLASLAGAAGLRLRNLTLTEEAVERRRLEGELHLARKIQVALLPQTLPTVAGYQLHGANAPSRGVSGDIYMAVERSSQSSEEAREECVLMVVDVAGKGMSASLLTASLEALSAGPIEEGDNPDEICNKLSRRLFSRTPPERYATAFLAILDPDQGALEYCSAGHSPALCIRLSGDVEPLPCTGMPLGLVPDAGYRSCALQLAPGDTLVAYTDGISEAMNSEQEEYGMERLGEVCSRHRDLPPRELAAAIEADLDEFVAGTPFDDDRTLLILRRER